MIVPLINNSKAKISQSECKIVISEKQHLIINETKILPWNKDSHLFNFVIMLNKINNDFFPLTQNTHGTSSSQHGKYKWVCFKFSK